MINGTHAIIYADDADQARAFFRDVLDFPYVDAHDGWLIFKCPPAELEARGVEFTTPVENQGFGSIARLRVPGAGEIGIYEPRHPTAYDLDA